VSCRWIGSRSASLVAESHLAKAFSGARRLIGLDAIAVQAFWGGGYVEAVAVGSSERSRGWHAGVVWLENVESPTGKACRGR
jgi:hypothetical protein